MIELFNKVSKRSLEFSEHLSKSVSSMAERYSINEGIIGLIFLASSLSLVVGISREDFSELCDLAYDRLELTKQKIAKEN